MRIITSTTSSPAPAAFTPANTNLVLIGIDRPSYDDVFITDADKKIPSSPRYASGFPWSRKVWAAAITRLADAGAKVIAIDLVVCRRPRLAMMNSMRRWINTVTAWSSVPTTRLWKRIAANRAS